MLFRYLKSVITLSYQLLISPILPRLHHDTAITPSLPTPRPRLCYHCLNFAAIHSYSLPTIPLLCQNTLRITTITYMYTSTPPPPPPLLKSTTRASRSRKRYHSHVGNTPGAFSLLLQSDKVRWIQLLPGQSPRLRNYLLLFSFSLPPFGVPHARQHSFYSPPKTRLKKSSSLVR